MKRVFVLLFVCCLFAAMAPRPVAADRVFYVGHSLVNFDMPMILDQVAASLKTPHETEVQIINGAPLKWNWMNSHEAQGADAKQVLASKRFDALVLTPASPIHSHLQWSQPADYGGKFYAHALRGNPTARAYLYATWPSRDRSAWKTGDWDKELAADLAGLKEVAKTIAYKHAPPHTPVQIVPASLVIRDLRDAIAAERVPGLSRFEDLFDDNIHMNRTGNYVIALTQYASLYQRSPVGATAKIQDKWGNAFLTLEPKTADALQRSVWSTVKQFHGIDE